MNQLQSLLDLRDLRWIWLTHIDADHIGNLRAVLDAAPVRGLSQHFWEWESSACSSFRSTVCTC